MEDRWGRAVERQSVELPQGTTEGPEVWGAAITSELISWCLRLEGTGSLTWEPLLWLVDVAGCSPPCWGGSEEIIGQTQTQLALTNFLLNKRLWASPRRLSHKFLFSATGFPARGLPGCFEKELGGQMVSS